MNKRSLIGIIVVLAIVPFIFSCAGAGKAISTNPLEEGDTLRVEKDRMHGLYQGKNLPILELAEKILQVNFNHPRLIKEMSQFLKPVEDDGLRGFVAVFILNHEMLGHKFWQLEIYVTDCKTNRDRLIINLQPRSNDPTEDKKFWVTGYGIQLIDTGLDSRVDQAQAESKVNPTGSLMVFSDQLYLNSELNHNFEWFQAMYEEIVPIILEFYEDG